MDFDTYKNVYKSLLNEEDEPSVKMESSLVKASTSSDDALTALLAYITVLISRYGILILVVLGTVGNTLNVIIFSQKKLRGSPCTVYLLTGACINMVLTVGITLPRMLTTYNLDYSASVGILCKLRQFAYYSLATLSVWMVALATFDRFLISSPLATRRQMSSFRNTYRLIAASSILLTLIFGDLFYCASPVNSGVITSCSASTSTQCGYYNQIARLLTVLFIPGTVILVFGTGIARNLRSLKTVPTTAARDESQQYRVRKTDRELIKLLIGQSAMLAISWVPLGIQRIYALVTTNVPKSPLRKTAEALSDELTSAIARFDDSLSFYVYLFAGGVLFRETIAGWFRHFIGRGAVAPVSDATRITRTIAK